MTSEKPSKTPQEESMPQAGNEDDVVILMRKLGLPMDRQTYLELAYFGAAPEELSAEEESELPGIFQQN